LALQAAFYGVPDCLFVIDYENTIHAVVNYSW
jgi:hypothetical protein